MVDWDSGYTSAGHREMEVPTLETSSRIVASGETRARHWDNRPLTMETSAIMVDWDIGSQPHNGRRGKWVHLRRTLG